MSAGYEAHPQWQKENREWILKLKAMPCLGCGLEWHPSVMSLDHPERLGKAQNLAGKRVNPSEMMNWPPHLVQSLTKELHALCFNCHQFLEKLRDQELRADRWQPYNNRVYRGALLTPSDAILNEKVADALAASVIQNQHANRPDTKRTTRL